MKRQRPAFGSGAGLPALASSTTDAMSASQPACPNPLAAFPLAGSARLTSAWVRRDARKRVRNYEASDDAWLRREAEEAGLNAGAVTSPLQATGVLGGEADQQASVRRAFRRAHGKRLLRSSKHRPKHRPTPEWASLANVEALVKGSQRPPEVLDGGAHNPGGGGDGFRRPGGANGEYVLVAADRLGELQAFETALRRERKVVAKQCAALLGDGALKAHETQPAVAAAVQSLCEKEMFDAAVRYEAYMAPRLEVLAARAKKAKVDQWNAKPGARTGGGGRGGAAAAGDGGAAESAAKRGVKMAQVLSAPMHGRAAAWAEARRRAEEVALAREREDMAHEDGATRVVSEWLEARGRRDDYGVYFALATRYGEYERDVFNLLPLPGTHYRKRCLKGARAWQRMWQATWPLLKMRKNAVMRRWQAVARGYLVRKHWRPIVRLRLKCGRFRYLKMAYHPWRVWARKMAKARYFLENYLRANLHRMFKGWRTYHDGVLNARHEKGRRFLKRLLDGQQYKIMDRWSVYTKRNLQVKRMFRRSLQCPCWDVWVEFLLAARRAKAAEFIAGSLQRCMRGRLARLFMRKLQSLRAALKRLIRGKVARMRVWGTIRAAQRARVMEAVRAMREVEATRLATEELVWRTGLKKRLAASAAAARQTAKVGRGEAAARALELPLGPGGAPARLAEATKQCVEARVDDACDVLWHDTAAAAGPGLRRRLAAKRDAELPPAPSAARKLHALLIEEDARALFKGWLAQCTERSASGRGGGGGSSTRGGSSSGGGGAATDRGGLFTLELWEAVEAWRAHASTGGPGYAGSAIDLAATHVGETKGAAAAPAEGLTDATRREVMRCALKCKGLGGGAGWDPKVAARKKAAAQAAAAKKAAAEADAKRKRAVARKKAAQQKQKGGKKGRRAAEPEPEPEPAPAAPTEKREGLVARLFRSCAQRVGVFRNGHASRVVGGLRVGPFRDAQHQACVWLADEFGEAFFASEAGARAALAAAARDRRADDAVADALLAEEKKAKKADAKEQRKIAAKRVQAAEAAKFKSAEAAEDLYGLTVDWLFESAVDVMESEKATWLDDMADVAINQLAFRLSFPLTEDLVQAAIGDAIADDTALEAADRCLHRVVWKEMVVANVPVDVEGTDGIVDDELQAAIDSIVHDTVTVEMAKAEQQARRDKAKNKSKRMREKAAAKAGAGDEAGAGEEGDDLFGEEGEGDVKAPPTEAELRDAKIAALTGAAPGDSKPAGGRGGRDDDDDDGEMDDAKAAGIVQRAYRCREARKKVRKMLVHAYRKQFDKASGYFFYMNTSTGEASWGRPTLFDRLFPGSSF